MSEVIGRFVNVDFDTGSYKSSRETNDCTVRGLANACGKDYIEAHRMCETHNRGSRRGMCMEELDRMFKSFTKIGVVKGPYRKDKTCTVNTFCKKHPTGRYFVVERGHAFAIINGVVYDYNYRGSRKVIAAWKIILPEEK